MHAVDGVSLSVKRGEMLALVGESGCGKTTTAQAVLRLVDPVSGSIRFDGRDLMPLGPRELRPLRRRIQVVYQDPYESLDPRLRVRAAVEEPLLIHNLGGSKAERAARVRDALVRVELSPPELFLDRYPHELSGGQRQRVAIAAALVLEPEVLVADEPVSMLDVSVRAGVLNLLDGLREHGLAILMITHDLSTAARFARADRGHVPRPDRGARPRGRGRAKPAAPVHEGAALGRPAARPARPDAAADPAGGDAGRGRDPERLPLPSTLPGRDRPLQRGGSGARAAGVSRGGSPGGVHLVAAAGLGELGRGT